MAHLETADGKIIRDRSRQRRHPVGAADAGGRGQRHHRARRRAAIRSRARPSPPRSTLIRNAKGRLIVTGLGKSGHIGRKIAATFASTGTPAFFVHAAEASHGDLGMITAEDVILALSWSGEQPEMKNLITYAKRFRIPLIAMTADARLHARPGRRRRAGAAEGARGLPAQSGADHLLADACWRSATRWRSRCWKAAASPRSISACCIPAASSARC